MSGLTQQNQIQGLEQRFEVVEAFKGGGFSSIHAAHQGDFIADTFQFNSGVSGTDFVGALVPITGKIRAFYIRGTSGVDSETSVEIYKGPTATGIILTWNNSSSASLNDLDFDVSKGSVLRFKTITGSGGGPTIKIAIAIESDVRAGKSAFESAVSVQGFPGSESQWLDSLKGENAIIGHSMMDYGAANDGVLHTVGEWLLGETLDRGYADLAAIQVDYPHVENLNDDVNWAAFEYIKQLEPDMTKFLTVYFPKGLYIFKGAGQIFRFNRHNMRIYGDGQYESRTRVYDEIGGDGLILNRKNGGSGSDYSPDRIDPFDLSEDTLGRQHLTLIDPLRANNYFVGQIVLIRYGASYYNQDYGELNKVVKIEGAVIYFENTIARNYLPGDAPYNGFIPQQMVVPAIGATVNVEFTQGPDFANNKNVTVGQYNFELTGVSGTIYTLKNSYKVAPGTVIEAETKLYKTYGIIRFPEDTGGTNPSRHIVENLVVEDMSFLGARSGVCADTTYNAVLRNCTFTRDTTYGAPQTGLSLQADLSRNILFDNCRFICDKYKGSQISRSTGNLIFNSCTFKQTGPHFSEFNHNCLVYNCDIDIDASNVTTNPNDAAISIGASCTGIDAINNRINAHNIWCGIGGADIQQFPQNTNLGNVIRGNKIYLTGVGGRSLIRVPGGQSTISDNFCYIEKGACFSFVPRGEERSRFDGMGVFKNNVIIGDIENVISIKDNVYIQDNVFRRIVNSDNLTTWGNIVNNSGASPGYPVNFKLTGNTFINWYLQDDSVLFTGEQKSDNDLSNNSFVDCRNTIEPNFILDFKEHLSPLINRTERLAVQIEGAETMSWLGAIQKHGGTITNSEKFVGKNVIRKIYESGLRDKIIKLSIFAGDAKASLIPLIGYGYTYRNPKLYSDAMVNGTTVDDFSSALGWTGDGSKRIEVMDNQFFDFADMGLVLQLTAGMSGSSEYIIGNSGTMDVGISKTPSGGVSTLSRNAGAGGVIAMDKGFLYSGVKDGTIGLDYYDPNETPIIYDSVVSTVYHTEANDTNRGITSILGIGTGVGFSGSIGGYAITKYLNQTEAETLRDIFKQAMIDLGRPVQTA